MGKIKIGDIVQSSKNKMMVHSMVIHSIENDEITCDWFDDKNKFHRESFSKNTLTIVN